VHRAGSFGADLAAIRSQINEIKQSYEHRIAALEQKLAQAENKASKAESTATKAETTASKAEVVANEARLNVRQPQTSASAFNPEISLILSGSYTNLKQNPSERRLQGFIPSNGELMPENRSFNLGESELVIAANIDPMFRGTLRGPGAGQHTGCRGSQRANARSGQRFQSEGRALPFGRWLPE
jgi:chromosome segregation ATPase